MRASLSIAGAVLVGALWGCSGNVAQSTQGTGGHGGATTATTTSTAATSSSTSSGTTSTASSGAGGADVANGSFATAQTINMNVALTEDLLASGNAQYFTFTGKKGEALDIEANAEDFDTQNPAPYDPSYIDTVISLYDATQHKIAENDQVVPPYSDDADLFTVLPADGTYYIRVTDCYGWTAESGKVCALPKTKTHTTYTLEVDEKDGSQVNVAEEPIPQPASPTPIKYYKPSTSQYYDRSDVFGTFENATAVDVFSFTVPAGVLVPQGRLTAYFYAIAAGSSEDGSTEPTGTLTVKDATGATVLAQINGASGGRIDLPAQAGTPYLLYVGRNDGLVGSNDFYVVFHEGGGSNPLETNDVADDTMAGAQLLTANPADAQGYVGAYISGDLTPAPTDVDYYEAAIPPNLPATARVTASCGSQLYGSGLRGLTLTLLDSKGNTLGASTETAGSFSSVSPVPVPAGASVYIRLQAASQDPVVTGTYYACGVSFSTQ
jgi:hypothetical protein